MIISICAENAFDKVQHTFTIKNIEQARKRRDFLQPDKEQ